LVAQIVEWRQRCHVWRSRAQGISPCAVPSARLDGSTLLPCTASNPGCGHRYRTAVTAVSPRRSTSTW
jgi:hypothetical protein